MFQKLSLWASVFLSSFVLSFAMEVESTTSAKELNALDAAEFEEIIPFLHPPPSSFCSFDDLPDDILWKIIFDNEDPLTQQDIYFLSISSKSLHDHLKILIPKTILSRFPTVLQYLKALTALEETEAHYQHLFTKYPSQLFYLDGYAQEIERLVKAEPFMHISPWFRLKSGMQRIQTLMRSHNIDPIPDERDCLEKMRCYLSALTRDPLLLTIASLATAGINGIFIWIIHTRYMSHQNQYLKNLNYLTSDKFFQDEIESNLYFMYGKYPICSNNHKFKNPLGCWNSSVICPESGNRFNNSEFKEKFSSGVDTILATLKNLNETGYFSVPSINTQYIYDIFSEFFQSSRFKPVCGELCRRHAMMTRLKNSQIIMRNTFSSCGERGPAYCNFKPHQISYNLAGTWLGELYYYEPECFVRKMTPEASVNGLVTMISFVNVFIVVLFLIGWCVVF